MPRDSSDRDLFARRPATNDVVRVYDRYGRGGWMPRVDWRQRVLPVDLHYTWNKPVELAVIIQLATNLGCARDVVHAARHLLETDPDRARGIRVLAEALMQSGESIEAQRLLERTSKSMAKNREFSRVLRRFGTRAAEAIGLRSCSGALWN